MSILFAIPLMMVPPPLDERTEILFAVNDMLGAVASGKQADMQRTVDADGVLYRLDLRKDPVDLRIRRNADMRAEPDRADGKIYAEKIGVPTLFQRGPLAQVWAPYVFAIDGRNTHCGIDNFTVVKREGRWIVASLSYTVEPLAACVELGAPESAQ